MMVGLYVGVLLFLLCFWALCLHNLQKIHLIPLSSPQRMENLLEWQLSLGIFFLLPVLVGLGVFIKKKDMKI